MNLHLRPTEHTHIWSHVETYRKVAQNATPAKQMFTTETAPPPVLFKGKEAFVKEHGKLDGARGTVWGRKPAVLCQTTGGTLSMCKERLKNTPTASLEYFLLYFKLEFLFMV